MCTLLLRHVLALLGVVTLCVASLTDSSMAQALSARSGPQTVALLELFTSEGCNSCPPADTWVSALAARGFTSERLVALGLHVDYWDRLGWPDRFAQPQFTQRQRAIAARHRTRTIYTPQVVLHGRDFPKWGGIEAEVQRINQTRARAEITLEATPPVSSRMAVTVQASVPQAEARAQARLYVALYENHLSSAVTAGENSGHTLRHDYVVRQWLGPVELDAQGAARLQQTLTLASDWKPADLGLVAFVQQEHTGDVLQTLALPLRP